MHAGVAGMVGKVFERFADRRRVRLGDCLLNNVVAAHRADQ